MIGRFEIVGSGSPRPEAEQVIFCDGTGGKLFREGADLELSHWRPNKTPAEYRAGTSTEICFRFLDRPRPGDWTVAVNNHVDVDGILSVYVLIAPDPALVHRQTIIEAAEMGDFWGWGEPPAQRVFQGVTQIMNSGAEGRAVYEEAFRRIPGLIDGTDAEASSIEASLAPLRRCIDLIEGWEIWRRSIADRLVHYIVPPKAAGDDDSRAAYAPEFNEAISEKSVLWPHARARRNKERVSLVSVQRPNGWFHSLWFPGYQWADTEGLWRVPGMNYHDGMGSYEIDNPRLVAAFEALQRHESAPGRWGLGGTKLPFGEELQSRFPLVGQFLDDSGAAAYSGLTPDWVAGFLQHAFDVSETD